ncbi:hypothetical protein [Cellulomonas fimi]|uniref:Uncharacterized protein n=1 Tax=Cellulomonas fimi TaxID=1708 RepID=A0A7Y0QH90_CELFI|nr:hypothetical protein [Cellulomonas fimi]NMR20040.1 hypothetical protein [Cellulomonas fimi]
MADLDAARAAKSRLHSRLAGRDGITGIGLARDLDGYRLQVNVRGEADRKAVPERVDGVEVTVRVTGPVRAQA